MRCSKWLWPELCWDSGLCTSPEVSHSLINTRQGCHRGTPHIQKRLERTAPDYLPTSEFQVSGSASHRKGTKSHGPYPMMASYHLTLTSQQPSKVNCKLPLTVEELRHRKVKKCPQGHTTRA